jgi:Cu/Ag efflux protein CusF
MKIAKFILAGAAAIVITGSTAIAQQSNSGTVTKIDEATGKIAIQPAQSGTVGANSGTTENEFKVQDGVQRGEAGRQGDVHHDRRRRGQDDHQA